MTVDMLHFLKLGFKGVNIMNLFVHLKSAQLHLESLARFT